MDSQACASLVLLGQCCGSRIKDCFPLAWNQGPGRPPAKVMFIDSGS